MHIYNIYIIDTYIFYTYDSKTENEKMGLSIFEEGNRNIFRFLVLQNVFYSV